MISDRLLDLGTWDGGATLASGDYYSPAFASLGPASAYADPGSGAELCVSVIVTEGFAGTDLTVATQVILADDDAGLNGEVIDQLFTNVLVTATHPIGTTFSARLNATDAGHVLAVSGKRYLGMKYVLTVTGSTTAGMLAAKIVLTPPASLKRHYRSGITVL